LRQLVLALPHPANGIALVAPEVAGQRMLVPRRIAKPVARQLDRASDEWMALA
jgi:hypothetical protein